MAVLSEPRDPVAETSDETPSARVVEPTVEVEVEVEVEFAGWLPAFQFFGNCGHHPQFAHTETPPPGYRFIRTLPQPSRSARRWPIWDTVARVRYSLYLLLCLPFVTLFTCIKYYGLRKSLRTLLEAVRLVRQLRQAGCAWRPTIRFLRSRHFHSQALVPAQPKLLFLTSVPYTYGQHPWLIEIEDVTTLFYPLINNGQTAGMEIRRSPYLPIVKALLEADNCRGIVTHIRSTAEALPRLFESDLIAGKTTYVPCGTALPDVPTAHENTGHVNLLFTCSWHQNPDSFFLRGGLEVLRAFEILHARYPAVRLTLRTGLPRLRSRYRRIVEQSWVRVIDRFLPDDEMDALMRSSHVFLLPAARVHVVSMLKAMAYGQVLVASDGWGFADYIEHEKNGLIVPGRYGKVSWEDPATGMLCEDYRRTRVADPGIVRGLVRAVSTLVEDPALRRRLGKQARHDVATKYNLANWNLGLQRALDKAA